MRLGRLSILLPRVLLRCWFWTVGRLWVWKTLPSLSANLRTQLRDWFSSLLLVHFFFHKVISLSSSIWCLMTHVLSLAKLMKLEYFPAFPCGYNFVGKCWIYISSVYFQLDKFSCFLVSTYNTLTESFRLSSLVFILRLIFIRINVRRQ